MKIKIFLTIFVFAIKFSTAAKLNGIAIKSNNKISIAGCTTSNSSIELDIANVRARLFINGDMWWNLDTSTNIAEYEVPKGSGKCALFLGALWIGGKDMVGQLKVAAQTYRQSGTDFWPGPVDTVTGTISASDCQHYDHFWKITRQEVFDFINGGNPSQTIIDWPGNGLNSQTHYLAPFYDQNADGIYDYTQGDYPKYDFNNSIPNVNKRLNGDQTIWWVFNDVGNFHGETGSLYPIGLEIHAQAFAFCTTDTTLANTTFYNYKLINRASTILVDTYIGNFTDVDLGNLYDDYVGCDVSRNFGYGYNGDSLDDLPLGYGLQLAAVGIDILQGPLADIQDSIDNDRDGVMDEIGERINMAKFIFYNNDFSSIGNPYTPLQYYNYLVGKWKDNSPLVFGQNGHLSGGPICDFMFPGNSDPSLYGTHGTNPGFNWSEENPSPGLGPNNPGDRRFVMSCGPIRFLPGQVEYITKAAIWARVPSGIDSSVQALIDADDKIQTFFDNNYQTISSCPLTNGIEEIKNLNFSVYPSPTLDFLIVKYNGVLNKKLLEVFSGDGKLVYSTGQNRSNEIKINTADWSVGIYFVRMKNEIGEAKTIKIIKM